MQNYDQQQEAVILKGIASQILSMNMPSVKEVRKLFRQFGYELVTEDQIPTNNYVVITNDCIQYTLNELPFIDSKYESRKLNLYFSKFTNKAEAISYFMELTDIAIHNNKLDAGLFKMSADSLFWGKYCERVMKYYEHPCGLWLVILKNPIWM